MHPYAGFSLMRGNPQQSNAGNMILIAIGPMPLCSLKQHVGLAFGISEYNLGLLIAIRI